MRHLNSPMYMASMLAVIAAELQQGLFFCWIVFCPCEIRCYCLIETWLILFDCQHIVCLRCYDFLGNFSLTFHCVNRYRRSPNVESIQQFWNCCNFIRLLTSTHLSQRNTVLPYPCTYDVQLVFSSTFIYPANCFAIDSNMLANAAPYVGKHPSSVCCFQLLGFDTLHHPAIGIIAWNSIG